MAKDFSTGYLTGLLKPKYRAISTILGENYIPDKGLDIFLDLNTFISAISGNKGYLQTLPFANNAEEDLIISLFGVLRHWREFAHKWEDVRIFLMYNDFDICPAGEREQLKAYLVPYNNKFENDRYKQLKYYFNEAVKIAEPLFDYLPRSYFIKCTKYYSFVVPELLADETRDRLVVSDNAMMTAYVFQPNTKMIYSHWCTRGTTQLSDPLMILQSLTKIEDRIMDAFVQNKVFYTLLNVIVGDKDRGIIGLPQTSMTAIANDLLRAVEKKEIPMSPKSIESVLSVVDKCHHDYIKKNAPLMDVALHAQMIKPSEVERLKSKLVDKSDIDQLMKFTIGDINLMELV